MKLKSAENDKNNKNFASIKNLIIGQLPPPIHGSNIMTKVFLQTLKNIGCQTFIVQKNFTSRQEKIGKFSIFKVIKIPIILLKIGKAIISYRPLFCFYFISVKYPTFLIDAFFLFFIKVLKVKCVLYIHGQIMFNIGSSSSKLIKFIVRKVFSAAFGVIILGENLRKDVEHFVSDYKLFILPNAIEDFDSENIVGENKKSDKIKVLYLSNLRRSKGIIEFLDMARIITTKFKHVKFIIAGPVRSFSLLNEINNFIRKEKLFKFIEMRGEVYGVQKENLLRKSDIFVFPTHDETFGLVNLEALKWGLPVISTNVGAIPEIVHHGVNGFIVEPRDAKKLADYLMILLEDTELRIKMGNAGKKLFENFFTLEVYENRLKWIINELTAMSSTLSTGDFS
jgi:glycosyltransferase involved in cell wall biosynthesis